jgi:uncharacterized protein YijF (DUF1287 family)
VLQKNDATKQVRLLVSGSCCYNRSMPTALKSRTSVLVLIVFSVWSIWSSALPQAPTPVLRQQFAKRLVAAAIERTRQSVRYVSAYVRIPYPNGDVPADTGVCTDEIIRSYRAVGVDLQKEVHEDMVRNFAAYPKQKRWRLDHPDPNIDHRRVPNLMVFFQRKGETLPITNRAADYAPGDLVTWNLGGSVPHIGIVVDQKARWSGRCMVVHNIGAGPKMEDVLFNWKITGHYRYFGPGGSQ